MADTKTDRLQQIVNEHAAALGMPPGRVTWSWMPRYPDFRPKNFDLVMFDDRAEHFDANRLDAVSLMLRKAFGVPTLADVVRSALADALFGWMP